MKKRTILDRALADTKKNYRKRMAKINSYLPDVKIHNHVELKGEFKGWSFVSAFTDADLQPRIAVVRVYQHGDEKFSVMVNLSQAGKDVMEYIRIYSMGYSDGHSDGELNETIRIFSTMNSETRKTKKKPSFVDDPHYIKPPVSPS